jgi:hypothetical protein
MKSVFDCIVAPTWQYVCYCALSGLQDAGIQIPPAPHTPSPNAEKLTDLEAACLSLSRRFQAHCVPASGF